MIELFFTGRVRVYIANILRNIALKNEKKLKDMIASPDDNLTFKKKKARLTKISNQANYTTQLANWYEKFAVENDGESEIEMAMDDSSESMRDYSFS